MELKWLSAFVTLAEYLNFNKAAASMYITQPALSKYIAALEDELDVRLFDRSKRSVALTDAGQAFLPQAKQVLKMTDEMVLNAKTTVFPCVRGPLRLAVDQHMDYRDCVSSGLYFSLNTFRYQHPSVKVDVSYLVFEDAMERLRIGTVDIAFSIVYTGEFKSIQTGGFQCLPLFQDKMVIVVPPAVRDAFDRGTPIHEALGGLKLLCIDDDTKFVIERLSSLSAAGITAQRHTCSSWNEVLMRANLGEGFYLLSEETAKKSAEPMECISLEELGHDEQVYHVALWKNPTTPITSCFLSILSV